MTPMRRMPKSQTSKNQYASLNKPLDQELRSKSKFLTAHDIRTGPKEMRRSTVNLKAG